MVASTETARMKSDVTFMRLRTQGRGECALTYMVKG